MTVEDNGPGIVRAQIPKIFGKLLYGSKFHGSAQSRGQQGIGISAAGMYGQLTTGKPVRIVSRTGKQADAHEFEISIDTAQNKPDVHEDEEVDWAEGSRHARRDRDGGQVPEGPALGRRVLEQTALANPHVTLHRLRRTAGAGDETVVYERGARRSSPRRSRRRSSRTRTASSSACLIAMLKDTSARSLSGFLQEEFSRVGPQSREGHLQAREDLAKRPTPRASRARKPRAPHRDQQTKIMAPPTACISPIGEEPVLSGMKKEVEADFYCSATRSREYRSSAGT